MQVVTITSPFRFRSRQELDQIRLAFVAKQPTPGVQLVASTTNGQSFTWQVGGSTMTDEEFGDALAAAYCSLGIFIYGRPSSNRVAARLC